LPALYVSLDLAIPYGGIKLGKPLPKICQFFGGESGDSLLQSFEFTREETLPASLVRGLMASCLTMSREYWRCWYFPREPFIAIYCH
jgi:hypothetical protein